MATASSMILRALNTLGIKTPGDTLGTSEGAYYLGVLNAMLDSWNNDGLMAYQIQSDSGTLVAGTASYTVGSGATFNTTRPVRITGAELKDVSGVYYKVDQISAKVYRELPLPTTQSNVPRWMYYDDGYDASGFGTMYLYPVPATANTLYWQSWKQLSSFASVSTALSLPPGYQRAIETNFALEIAPGNVEPSAALVRLARESKALIEGKNVRDDHMRLDAGIVNGRGFSIYIG